MRKLAGLMALVLSAASLPANGAIVVAADTAIALQGSFSYTNGVTNQIGDILNPYTPSNFQLLPRGTATLYGLRQPPSAFTTYTNFFGTSLLANFGDNQPYFWVAYSSSPQTFNAASVLEGNLMGTYYGGVAMDALVYFRFFNLQDSGGDSGTFSGNFCFSTSSTTCSASTAPVPLPAAAWLMLSGLGGLGLLRKRKAA